jgi:cbb3-type cytochrome oxidase subunit 1
VVWHFLRKGLFFTLIAAVLVALLALPPVSAICQFTGMTASRNVLWLLAAISFPLFAVLYKGIAGLRGYDSWCHCLAQTHLWLAFTGVCFLVGTMFLEGLFTGLAMNDAVVTFRNVTSYAFPFHVLQMVGWLIFFVSTLLVGANFIRAIACKGITPSK